MSIPDANMRGMYYFIDHFLSPLSDVDSVLPPSPNRRRAYRKHSEDSKSPPVPTILRAESVVLGTYLVVAVASLHLFNCCVHCRVLSE